MVVEDGSRGKLFLLLFIEAKKGRAAGGDIAEMESQAYSAGYEYYMENERRNRIWAMTCYGSCARFWAFDFEERSGLPTPFFPREGNHGEKSAYADFKSFEHEIMEAFRYIKENPLPPDSVFAASPAASVTSDLGLAGPSSATTDILTQDTATLVRVVRIRSQGPEVETRRGNRTQTAQARWLPAQCLVDGEVIDGYKYVGNSGTVYWTMNSISP
ncbi:hypothetical protein ColTof3_08579 [Colletotrichum tofieldiae]|nr:hypothetical protein ColTof3_08579 [Colletotrichum tofieldiae]